MGSVGVHGDGKTTNENGGTIPCQTGINACDKNSWD
jgi:hypothetical protein